MIYQFNYQKLKTEISEYMIFGFVCFRIPWSDMFRSALFINGLNVFTTDKAV